MMVMPDSSDTGPRTKRIIGDHDRPLNGAWVWLWLVLTYVSVMYVAFDAAGFAVVVTYYGLHGWFVDHIRVVNWHQGVLSNGVKLNPWAHSAVCLGTFFLMAFLIYAVLTWIRRTIRRVRGWLTGDDAAARNAGTYQ
jgi:hypothetical protein